MKELPSYFYDSLETAETARVVMDTKDLKELLLSAGGTTIVRGKLFDLKPKSLGAGVHRVMIKRVKP